MTPRRLAAMLVLLTAASTARAGEVFDDETLAFLAKVDADKLTLMGVQYKGRIAIFDSMARHLISKACGTQRLDGVAPSAAMMELYFNTGAYLDKPVLYVKGATLRRVIAENLSGEDRRRFRKTHRMPPGLMINDRAALSLFRAGRATAKQCFIVATNQPFGRKFQEATEGPGFRKNVDNFYVRLMAFLTDRIFRPVPLDDSEEWATAEDILIYDIDLPGRGPTGFILGQQLFLPMMKALRDTRAKEAEAEAERAEGHVQKADKLAKEARGLARMAHQLARRAEGLLREVNGVRDRYVNRELSADDPNAKYLALYKDFLALRDAWRSRDARKVNELVARLAEGAEAASTAGFPHPFFRRMELLYNRSYHGTIVWAACAVATLLLIVAVAAPRQRVWRISGLSVLGLSTAVMVAGFVIRWIVSARAWYLPPIMNQFEAVIGAAMLGALLAIPLELVWKKNYYALSAAFYATVSLLCAFFMPDQIDSVIKKAQMGILSSPIMAVHVSVIIIGHALVGMTLVISLAYITALAVRGLGREGEPPSTGPDLTSRAAEGPLATIDRCNLIVAQLACWTVLVGTILGAYWADFAWARWWGWDRKETWALITCLIYVVILHVRFIVPLRWRGLVTSLGCVVGCGVMMFNWIVVNFYLKGLHSYA